MKQPNQKTRNKNKSSKKLSSSILSKSSSTKLRSMQILRSFKILKGINQRNRFSSLSKRMAWILTRTELLTKSKLTSIKSYMINWKILKKIYQLFQAIQSKISKNHPAEAAKSRLWSPRWSPRRSNQPYRSAPPCQSTCLSRLVNLPHQACQPAQPGWSTCPTRLVNMPHQACQRALSGWLACLTRPVKQHPKTSLVSIIQARIFPLIQKLTKRNKIQYLSKSK